MTRTLAWLGFAFTVACHAGDRPAEARPPAKEKRMADQKRITHTEAEWRKLLSPEQYRVMREQGTERAFTGPYWNDHDKGVYRCAACGLELFRSEDKFDSGTGWPS